MMADVRRWFSHNSDTLRRTCRRSTPCRQPPETSRRPPPRDCLRHSRDLGSILAPRACSVCEAPSARDETFPRSRTHDPPTPPPSHPRPPHPPPDRPTPPTPPELRRD